MLQNLTGWHALIVLAVILLIFGAAKLPALARSVGQSVRILKSESRDDDVTGSPAPREPEPLTTASPVATQRPAERAGS